MTFMTYPRAEIARFAADSSGAAEFQQQEELKKLKQKAMPDNGFFIGSMMGRMEIILSSGFDCTKDELQMVVDKYTEGVSSDIGLQS